MRLILIVDKDVAKTFGIELDSNNRPLRKNGRIVVKRPKGVPPHIQTKFVEFLDKIEKCEEYNEILSVLREFQFKSLKASKYTKKLVEISRGLLYRIYGVSADSNRIRLLRIKLSRNYRVSLGLWVKENGEVVVFFFGT